MRLGESPRVSLEAWKAHLTQCSGTQLHRTWCGETFAQKTQPWRAHQREVMNPKNVDKPPPRPLPTNIRGFTRVKSRVDAGDTIGCKVATTLSLIHFSAGKIKTWTGSIFYCRYSWNITKLWWVLLLKENLKHFHVWFSLSLFLTGEGKGWHPETLVTGEMGLEGLHHGCRHRSRYEFCSLGTFVWCAGDHARC